MTKNVMSKEYDTFRKQINIIWAKEKPETIMALKMLMYQRGFRKKKDIDKETGEISIRYLHPTTKQTQLAWEYIESRYIEKKPEKIFYRLEQYKRHKVYRATAHLIFIVKGKEKRYKSGQFIPHDTSKIKETK